MTQRVIVLSEAAAAFANTPAVMPVVEDIYSIRSDRREWFVVYTDPNREGKAIEGLADIGVRTFFPKTVEWKPRTRAERDRKKPLEAVERPLFSRYPFAELPVSSEAFSRVRQVDGVQAILGISETKVIPVQRKFVELLREQEKVGVFDKTVKVKVKPTKKKALTVPEWAVSGKTVRIADGPFATFLGVVERSLPKDLMEVAVEIFGRPTTVRLELAQVTQPC